MNPEPIIDHWCVISGGADRMGRSRAPHVVPTLIADLGDRVRALARVRTMEGYMARAKRQRDGSFLLIEDHCPICAAAQACQGFCRSELEVFQAALGADVSVTREEHLLSGARRCAYRIAPAEARR